MQIGIPEGLLYYNYHVLWETFFINLGADIIKGGGTNKDILNNGVKLCVDEACLPVKVYHGHIKNLAGKCDIIFMPRIISICKNEYICPKFCGLPEMIKNSIPDLPPLLDTSINLRKSENNLADCFFEIGKTLTGNKNKIMSAYKIAAYEQAKYENKIQNHADVILNKNTLQSNKKLRKIALLGHPYIIYDNYLNMNIKNKLGNEGYVVITPEMLGSERIDRYARLMPKRHFWTLGRKILGSGLSFIQNRDIDGIIYLSSFGCGIDSLIEDYLERHIKRDGRIPYMKLILDEHSGEAGFMTRLEAFLDMVKWREENESNVSPYGGDLCGCQGIS